MNDSKEKLHDPPAGRLKRLKHDTAATAAELREFLSQVSGKNPKEVIGNIASNGLVKSTALAAVFIVIFLLLTSTVAYMITPEKSETADAKTNPLAVQPKTDATPETDSAATSAETTKSGDKTLDNLGVGETKIAAPDENPLDKKFDDLLDKKID